ncbi:MAG TPA: metal ABC transporter ATP-binding protein [Paracoccaceae bacterium]|nr:metal ABC transporter ATP-binding protein [Paracoccaceae bacterium]
MLIRAEDISVTLGGRQVLHDVHMEVREREIVTIVGPNGSGKTTLLRVLIGAIQPDRGRVERAPGLRIGYVPQKLDLDSTLPITARRFLSLPKRQPGAAITSALERAGALAIQHQPLASLSGGQFQRVLLARALLTRPHLLLLDEPTQGLDQPATAAFYTLIAELRDELGCAVLMVSHDLHVVMQASDRVICLNGHICCEGTPTDVSAAPEYRALFGTGTRGALALYRHEHDHEHGAGSPPPASGGAAG